MTHPRQSNLVAVGFMLLASALIAGTSLLAKAIGHGVLGDALHPLQISHGRFLFAFIAISCAVAVIRPRFTKPELGLHVVRTTCGWAGISLMFAAIAYIPLSDATAISFLNPVCAMMLAIPLLGERVGPVRWGAAAIALLGALVLLRPGTGSFQPAAFLALGAAAVMGLEITIIKLLSGREAPIQILIVNNTLGLIIASIAVLFVWQAPTPSQWIALAALGTMMALAQTCFIQSMRRAEASFVAPFSYATLVFVTLYDLVIFNTRPDAVSLIGAAIIIAGAGLLVWREARVKSSGFQPIPAPEHPPAQRDHRG
ncbi:DMT family transporter [Aliiroseovarius sp. YM-037]|uniref:DMT family transporter n=1 Tax=Aliiroseovarius sp. YM-037 TaxID=3341728 RepID=UPI003A808380